jgi:hemerythrin-like domain-containing protein
VTTKQTSAGPLADTRIFNLVHRTFRLATERLAGATEKLPPSTLQPILRSRWGFYSALLDHHHHSEDESIYPALLTVRPDLKSIVATLAEEHGELTTATNRVDEAVSAFEKTPGPKQQRSLHEAVVAVRDVLFPHLDVEDAKILPAITESMPIRQWDWLDKQALRTIPRRYLPTAVGALDEVIQSLPDAQRPPPPPPPIRLMLALSWRKKWSTWVKPLLV